MAIRGFKSILNVRPNLFVVLVIVVLTAFITAQFMDSLNLCPTASERLSKRRRFNNNNIDPKVLAELKKRWFLEYEEEQKLNQNENRVNAAQEPKSGFKDTMQPYLPIDCSINGDEIVNCLRRKDSDETGIYMPWDFIKKYFEVYGKLGHYDGYDRFEFSQTYSQVFYDMKKQYYYDGGFMTFETYNVEIRDRVKLVTGVEGVPLSTQWGSKGYFYPIQIAQFAISHYSKNITEKAPMKTVYESGEMLEAKWTLYNSKCQVESINEVERTSKVIKFYVPLSLPRDSGVTLTLGNTVEFELSLDIKFVTDGSLTIVVDGNDKKRYQIHYVTNGKKLIDFDGDQTIWYHIGKTSKWRHISRDLRVDLRKGIGMTNTKAVKKVRTSIKKVVSLTLRGEGFIDNVSIVTADHTTHFLAGSYWILHNQNHTTGGWPIMIERRLEGLQSLPPGWHSAMAQGHGLSAMSRAYKYTKDVDFRKALRLALRPYTIPSSKGGVKAVYMDKFVWYEEYPTTPSSFVLNGFIFSLFGLYDYKMLLTSEVKAGARLSAEDEEALHLVTDLYNTGMSSLKNMLPLYDAGYTTIYDLKHHQVKTQPNLARWDYHATHISQLAMLSTIDDDPIFKEFHGYWMGYTKGIRAKHN